MRKAKSDAAADENICVNRIRIYQISRLDSEYVFRDYDYVKANGRSSPPSELYKVVFDGRLGTDDPEELFHIFNLNHPEGYKGRSLSVSDIVEVYDGNRSHFFYCDTFGFKKIQFKSAV